MLADDALHVTLTIRNLSDRRMPFGFGHHPYFPRTASTFVHARVDVMWHGTPDPLPLYVGPHPAVDALNSPQGMAVDRVDLDNHFTGWGRETTVAWPDEGRAVTLRVDALFDFTVIYAPKAFLRCCAWSRSAMSRTGYIHLDVPHVQKGDGVLAPGEAASASFSLTPQSN